jgi:hypothetical protein
VAAVEQTISVTDQVKIPVYHIRKHIVILFSLKYLQFISNATACYSVIIPKLCVLTSSYNRNRRCQE